MGTIDHSCRGQPVTNKSVVRASPSVFWSGFTDVHCLVLVGISGAFEAIFAFEAVSRCLLPPPPPLHPVLMLWIPDLDMLALFVCSYVTLYANAALVQSDALKKLQQYNLSKKNSFPGTWMSLDWISNLLETAYILDGTRIIPPAPSSNPLSPRVCSSPAAHSIIRNQESSVCI